MGVGTNIQEFGHFLEECDEGVGTVHGVEFTGQVDSKTGSTADVELSVPATTDGERDGFAVADLALDADGRLRITLETTAAVVPTTDHELEVEPTTAALHEDGTVSASIRASVGAGVSSDTEPSTDEPSGGGDCTESTTSVDDESPADDECGDRDVPPFRDPELLADVYDSCETFAEMSEAIEMDVTAETVRRYMIDYGIHEPNQYDTDDEEPSSDGSEVAESEPETTAASPPASGDNGAEPVILTDGLGLPDDVTVDGLVETVSRSNTIYEVTRDVELERDEALELLRRLNLLEFVVGRISDVERDVERDQILDRLREASAVQTRP